MRNNIIWTDIIVYVTYVGMWVRPLVYYFTLFNNICQLFGHLPMHVSTPPNKIEQFCLLADTCIHDTIPICGRMGDEKRTFMDLCDLLEYACDTNQIFTHIDDTEDCPLIKAPS